MKSNSFVVENLQLEQSCFDINEFITLKRNDNDNSIIIIVKDSPVKPYESSGNLFYKSLQLAVPEVNLRVSKIDEDDTLYQILKDYNTFLLNYYGTSSDEFIINNGVPIIITEETVEKIKLAHQIVTEHNQKAIEAREEKRWRPSRWGYSFQNYSSACYATTLDLSILSIITGMESLLVMGEGPISYKVSLFSSLILSDDYEERLKINKLVKDMYNIRSKVVHGEISAVIKLLKSSEIYKNYFLLKRVHSELLLKTYNIDENDLFESINKQIFNCPAFD